MAGTERADASGSAQAAAERLREMSGDARAVVVLDANGEFAGSSGTEPEQAHRLAELAGELLEAVDAAAVDGPPEQVEAQVDRGSVYVVRRPRWTLATVARRSALSSLMFYDVRAALSELEAAQV